MLILTATDLPRVMQCVGSLGMPASPVPSIANPVREEGNAAHWLIEQVHSGKFTLDELIDRQAPNGVFITAEMADNVASYLLAIGKGGDIEVVSSIGTAAWRVNNRADHVRATRDTLHIDDFKYGYSLVEPEMNWTLLAYAFGFVQNNRAPYPDRIIMTIHQPRAHHPTGKKVRPWEISYATLEKLWATLNDKLTNPSGVLSTGEFCKNCPSMDSCPGALKAAMNAVDISEMSYVAEVGDSSLSSLLDTVARASTMLQQLEKAYKELAKHRIQQGHIVRHYGLENDLTNRQWLEHVTPEFMQAITGKDLTKKQLLTPSQVEKQGVSKEIVETLTGRVSKGVKLVRIDENDKGNKLFSKEGK